MAAPQQGLHTLGAAELLGQLMGGKALGHGRLSRAGHGGEL
jgi:hypothetical protein